jgi:hypothetical protein
VENAVDSLYAHIACCIDDSEASRLALDEACARWRPDD